MSHLTTTACAVDAARYYNFPPTELDSEKKSMVNHSVLLLPSSSCSSLFLPLNPSHHTTLGISKSPYVTTQKAHVTLISIRSSNKRTTRTSVIAESEEKPAIITSTESSSASDIVRNFYDGINKDDLASVEVLIAENCVYEDLVFPKPFVGRKAILEFFKKFNDSISKNLQFVIDDISCEDSLAVGVTWHLEWKGRPFPFSRGCSFYRLEIVNGKKQIIYGRDSMEPAIKPGETALVAIKGVTWLLERFPQLADRI